MGRPKTTEREAYSVDSLTDVAVRVFLHRGYDATRIEHIARAANVTTSSLYHHVAGKEELLARALDRAFVALAGVFDQVPPGDGTPVEQLAHVIRRTVAEELRLQPELALLLRIRGNTPLEESALERRRHYEERFTGMVRDAQASGDIRNDIDARLLVKLMLGMVNSAVEWYRPDGSWSARQLADVIWELLLCGAQPRAGA
jgi:AcrR family transcriptional regulator